MKQDRGALARRRQFSRQLGVTWPTEETHFCFIWPVLQKHIATTINSHTSSSVVSPDLNRLPLSAVEQVQASRIAAERLDPREATKFLCTTLVPSDRIAGALREAWGALRLLKRLILPLQIVVVRSLIAHHNGSRKVTRPYYRYRSNNRLIAYSNHQNLPRNYGYVDSVPVRYRDPVQTRDLRVWPPTLLLTSCHGGRHPPSLTCHPAKSPKNILMDPKLLILDLSALTVNGSLVLEAF